VAVGRRARASPASTPVPRFSTMTGWPSAAVRPGAMMRATKSLPPPAAAVMMRTLRIG
jgi:hypothetical protein